MGESPLAAVYKTVQVASVPYFRIYIILDVLSSGLFSYRLQEFFDVGSARYIKTLKLKALISFVDEDVIM